MLGGAPVTEIGENAFSNADSLRSVTLPDGIRTIAGRAFVHCRSLRAIELPDGVEEIGAEAFYGSGITDITIPESVKRVGSDAFYQTPYFDAQTDEFVIVGDGVLIGYNGDGGEVVLPDGVRYISRAFYRQYGRSEVPIQSVVLPEGVTEIGESAFLSIQTLESVMLPDSLRRIGQAAFCECRALKSIALPAGVTEIADRTFSGCEALERITLSESTVSIARAPFSAARLPPSDCRTACEASARKRSARARRWKRFRFPAGVREIGGWAFKGTPYFETLTDEFVIAGDGVLLRYNGDETTVRIPTGVKYIAGFGEAAAEVVLPDGVTGIADYAFRYSGLTGITLPESVRSIGRKRILRMRSPAKRHAERGH